MLLILSSAEDVVAQRVAAELERRGASFAMINPPMESVRSSLQCALRGQGSRIRSGGRTIALDDVETVWMWRPEIEFGQESKAVARLGDAAAATYVEHEW